MNTDDKTIKKMKQYSKNTDIILANVKIEGDRLRNMNSHNRGQHNMPIPQGPYGHFPPNIGIMNMQKGNMPVPPPMPNQYPMMMNQMMPPMLNIPNLPPPMGKPQGNEAR